MELKKIAAKYGISITYLAETSSTNDAARTEGFSEGDIVIADRQSAGRGQRGNHWESNTGENLTFSMVLNPSFLPIADQFLLSETVSLAIVDVLEMYGLQPRIKWPNDIYIYNRKVAGILIENDLKGTTLYRSIVGVGLNVNQTVFSPALPNPASMKTAVGWEFDRTEVLENFIAAFGARYRSLSERKIDHIETDYHARLYRQGEPTRFSLPDGTEFMGVIKNVRRSGELIVAHPDGQIAGYLFKEIEMHLPAHEYNLPLLGLTP